MFYNLCEMKLPTYSKHSAHWLLDSEIVFLNHGSFGATPKFILEKQNQYRAQMEAEPVRFMIRELENMVWETKTSLGNFLGAQPEDLAFVPNATYGVNTILNSLEFNEGDELLTHNHAYGACFNTMKFIAEKRKAKMVVAEIPYPLTDENEVVEAILKSVTPKTKIAMIDFITSATGVVFPIEKIVKALQERGVDVLVDGAHAPGMMDFSIDKIGAAYFTGNCHKWICTPKGSAFLHVRKDKQKFISPLTVSHTYDVPDAQEKLWSSHFFWPGTNDFTAYLCIKDAIEYFENNFEGGWKGMRNYNHSLCLQARKLISEKTGLPLTCPENMIGNLSNIFIGETELPPFGFNYIHPIQEKLFQQYKIEVPVFIWNNKHPRTWLRISVQAYNSIEQFDYLAEALKELLNN